MQLSGRLLAAACSRARRGATLFRHRHLSKPRVTCLHHEPTCTRDLFDVDSYVWCRCSHIDVYVYVHVHADVDVQVHEREDADVDEEEHPRTDVHEDVEIDVGTAVGAEEDPDVYVDRCERRC